MELISVKISNFRRFRSETIINTSGKLVAILGSNEAGKSSILQAILYLSHDQKFQMSDIPRDTQNQECFVEGQFLLDESECKTAKVQEGTKLVVAKNESGTRNREFKPIAEQRSLLPRERLNKRINKLVDDEDLSEKDYRPEFQSGLRSLPPPLSLKSEDIPPAQLQLLTSFVEQYSNEEFMATKQETNILKAIQSLIKKESERNPKQFALNALLPLIPQILEFSIPDRELKGQYVLSEVIKDIPPALENLADISELDLSKLNGFVQQGAERPEIAQMQEIANKCLDSAFKKIWSQSQTKVTFWISGDNLHIHMKDGDKHSSLTERSDGLRQFVALRAFMAKRTQGINVAPILIVDEAELHLHYDGQADLIQVFARQKSASKVIYSTHSVGCLPEDLGTGVRLVKPSENDGVLESTVQNKFWANDQPGFFPLLIGMGARNLAFFPVRRALIGEGVTEMLLLPQMFRDATELDTLGFQAMGGLSELKVDLSKLQSQGSRVGYFVDSDGGGKALRKTLLERGADKNLIFSVDTGTNAASIEDFVDSEVYATAANRLYTKVKQKPGPVKPAALKGFGRYEKVKTITGVKLAKVDIALEIAAMIMSRECKSVLDPAFQPEFNRIYVEMQKHLEIENLPI